MNCVPALCSATLVAACASPPNFPIARTSVSAPIPPAVGQRRIFVVQSASSDAAQPVAVVAEAALSAALGQPFPSSESQSHLQKAGRPPPTPPWKAGRPPFPPWYAHIYGCQ